MSVYDWCTKAYNSAEARSTHTMSPTSPYSTHGHAVTAAKHRHDALTVWRVIGLTGQLKKGCPVSVSFGGEQL